MLRALLFDLDGTMVDSDPIHYRAWQAVLAEYGIQLDPEGYRTRISGKLNPEIVEDWLPSLPIEARGPLIAQKEARFRALATALHPLAGLDALLAWANSVGLLTAVVTNAPRGNLEFMLGALGLASRFEVQVLGEDLSAAKPDPLPYRLALERLGVSATEAVAFEDSRSGVLSAVTAQIPTVGIASSQDPETLYSWGAVLVSADFEDRQLKDWLGVASGDM